MLDRHALGATVQRNCDIADARFARDYSMCTYLLKMREFYRWRQGYGLPDPLPADAMGHWIQNRECEWDAIEAQPFAKLRLNGKDHDPFDDGGINRILEPHGLVYSAGLGRFAQPHFFLGRLERCERRGDLTLYVAGEEYARDLTAPPGMARDGRLFVRRESLRRVLWLAVEEWRLRPRPGPMAWLVDHYGFDLAPEEALERMTGHELDALSLHEIGEARAGDLLGSAWGDALLRLSASKAELYARAARDHLADCLITLPALLEREDRASLHYYFANLQGIRREIFPAADIAYRRWVDEGGFTALRELLPAARAHWERVAGSFVPREGQSGEHALAVQRVLAGKCVL